MGFFARYSGEKGANWRCVHEKPTANTLNAAMMDSLHVERTSMGPFQEIFQGSYTQRLSDYTAETIYTQQSGSCQARDLLILFLQAACLTGLHWPSEGVVYAPVSRYYTIDLHAFSAFGITR